jgi:hypothetical protein
MVCNKSHMDWFTSRERLGAELIGARDAVTLRWRERLSGRGQMPRALEAAAAELVLQAGAALADGASPETPWIRCGGILRVDAQPPTGALLASELVALWEALEGQLARIAFSDDEQRAASDVLALQLAAAQRGAAAEAQETHFEIPISDPSLRFGGVKLVSFGTRAAAAAAIRAA